MFIDLGIIVTTALVLGLVFVRFRLPMVVGYLIAGMLIGPFGLGFMKSTTTIELIAPIGIVLLLFLIGLELEPSELRKIGLPVVLFTTVEVFLSLTAGILMGLLLGMGLTNAIFLGAILSISSTAIVGKILIEKNWLNTREGRLLIGVLILEDLIAVFFLLSLPTLAVMGYIPFFDAVLFALKGVGLFFLISAFGVMIVPKLIDFIGKYEVEAGELGFLLSLGLGMFFAVVAGLLGFSPAIGAFLTGLTIVGKHSKFISAHLTPIKNFFIILFFVSMGTLVDVNSFIILGFMIIPLLVVSVASKFFGVLIGARITGIRGRATSMGFSMVSRGEFSFIIARTGSDLGMIAPYLFPVAGAISIATSIIGPL